MRAQAADVEQEALARAESRIGRARRSASGSSARGPKIGSGPSVITRIRCSGQPDQAAMSRREASETVTIRSAQPHRGRLLESPGEPPAQAGKDQLRMRERQRVVHRDDQLPHVPDREEAVGGREVHEVDARTGRRPGPSRSCRASAGAPAPTPPGSAPRPPRRSTRSNRSGISTAAADGPIDEDGELDARVGCCDSASSKLPREPAKSPPIGKAASVDSDSHGEPHDVGCVRQDAELAAATSDRARHRDSRRGHIERIRRPAESRRSPRSVRAAGRPSGSRPFDRGCFDAARRTRRSRPRARSSSNRSGEEEGRRRRRQSLAAGQEREETRDSGRRSRPGRMPAADARPGGHDACERRPAAPARSGPRTPSGRP